MGLLHRPKLNGPALKSSSRMVRRKKMGTAYVPTQEMVATDTMAKNATLELGVPQKGGEGGQCLPSPSNALPSPHAFLPEDGETEAGGHKCDQPGGIQRNLFLFRDLAPQVGEGNRAVTGEGEYRTRGSQRTPSSCGEKGVRTTPSKYCLPLPRLRLRCYLLPGRE